ncbi:unnamed protein product [Paramecium octaurelia]|uniref:Transmembrane protein n=1 Tax=Paramecium octaurelia TaxID=43137 RepID=A0A8S1UC53_PAROT|nr:unnamed protein product [Paramecium octaurelia]
MRSQSHQDVQQGGGALIEYLILLTFLIRVSAICLFKTPTYFKLYQNMQYYENLQTSYAFYILQLYIEKRNKAFYQFQVTYCLNEYYIILREFQAGYQKKNLNQYFSQLSFYINPEETVSYGSIIFIYTNQLIIRSSSFILFTLKI